MQVGLKEYFDSNSDFTIPVDKKGLVIYFSINEKRFLFNGHNGSFYDSLPQYAEKTFDALLKPKEDQGKIFESLKRKYSLECENMLDEIDLFQNGTHPDLTAEPKQKHFSQKMSPHLFNVYIAQRCNMACVYCFNQGGTFGKVSSLMSNETAKNVLDFITNIARTEVHQTIMVNLFGGEPLLAPKALYTVARGLQDFNHKGLRTKIKLMLSTNGTIYNKKIFDILAERPDLCRVVISLDAFKGIHDKNRPFANPKNGSSYDAVLKNLKRMIQEKIPYSVICVVPYPYNYIAASEKLHNLGVECLEIKQLIGHVFGKTVLPKVFHQRFGTWRQNYIAYSDYHINYLKEKNPIRHVDRFSLFHDYARKLTNNKQAHTTLACGVADVVIGIDSDGKFFPCESFLGHKPFELGDAKKGFDNRKYDEFEEWLLSKGQHRIDNKRCRNCYAKLICGGGCYAEAIDKTNRLCPPNEPYCSYLRETVKIDLYYISQLRKHHPKTFSRITGIKN